MTQANLFEPTIPPELTGDALKVAGILLDHRGRLLSSRTIAAMLGWPERKEADVRNIITTLVDVHHLEIVGNRNSRNGGYRFADSRQEFEDAQYANLSQALTSFTRIKARLGERRFRAALVRLKVREVLSLEAEIGEQRA
jgi:hypothetical protein